MLLVDYQLKEAIPKLDLITPYNEDLVGPNSVDVLLGSNFKKLINDDYITPQSKIIDPYKLKNNIGWKDYNAESILLEPNEFILASTIEYVQIPKNMYGIIAGKSTLAREGIMVECAGFLDAGFRGQLTLEIKNLLPHKYRLYHRQLIAQITFFICNEVENDYSSGKHNYYEQMNATRSKGLDRLYRFCK